MTAPSVIRWLVVAGLALLPARAWAQTETVEYYATDALGSVRVVFAANGTIIGRVDFTPFGDGFAELGSLPSSRFARLTDDPESGFAYTLARSYQGRTGRFSTVDPIQNGLFAPQRWNRYVYAVNSPASHADPTGLADCVVTDTSTCVTGTAPYVDLSNAANETLIIFTVSLSPLRATGGRLGGAAGGGGGAGRPASGGGSATPSPQPPGPPSPQTPGPPPPVLFPCVPSENGNEFSGCGEAAREFDRLLHDNFVRGTQEAWRNGYYNCLASELVFPLTGPVVTKGTEEAVGHIVEETTLPERVVGAFYKVVKSDKRFTAWGTTSKVLVPPKAAAIRGAARVLSGVGWAFLDYEIFHSIDTCLHEGK